MSQVYRYIRASIRICTGPSCMKFVEMKYFSFYNFWRLSAKCSPHNRYFKYITFYY